jgi:hypothetical protein
MHEALRGTPELARKLAALEKKLTSRLDVHEAAIVEVLQELMQILNPPALPPEPPKPRIGFTPDDAEISATNGSRNTDHLVATGASSRRRPFDTP